MSEVGGMAEKFVTLDADHVYYKDLNIAIKKKLEEGAREIILKNINGQRYIGAGVTSDSRIVVEGVPGNDLGMFTNGLTIEVFSNAQDGLANTMNDGKIIIHGDAGDVLGYGMRGGKLLIEGDVGYRVGIHMKAFREKVPRIVIGGTARDFFGEYMAGGIIVLLGLNRKQEGPDFSNEQPLVGKFAGTGMHGGVIYMRGEFERAYLGKEVKVMELDNEDRKILESCVSDFCEAFQYSEDKQREILSGRFYKLAPWTSRPYGNIYAH